MTSVQLLLQLQFTVLARGLGLAFSAALHVALPLDSVRPCACACPRSLDAPLVTAHAHARITRRVRSHPLRLQEGSDIASVLINCPVEWRVPTATASRNALQLKPHPTSTTIIHHPNSLCVLRVHDMTRHAPQPMARAGNVVVFGSIEQAAMRLHTITASRSFDSHMHVTHTYRHARTCCERALTPWVRRR